MNDRPFDYNDKQPDGLYPRCMCGLPWSAHHPRREDDGPFLDFQNDACPRYRPMIGKFGRTENKPIKTYSETFGYEYDEDGRAVGRSPLEVDDAGARFTSKYDNEVFKAEHTHTISRRVLNRIAAHGARDFPRECCGFILGDKVEDVRPIKNTNKYGFGSYTMDVKQQMAVLREVENGKELKVVYHSHPNMGAFFSGIDRNAATSIDSKQPDWPDTVWIVMSIVTGTKHKHVRLQPFLNDARAYLWNPAITDFSEITLTVVE